ncbi:Imidazole glycerol phosphate synthase subunit HisF [Lysinibacillus sphaericus]
MVIIHTTLSKLFFKALARAIDAAVEIDPRVKGVSFHKGAVNVKIGVIDYGMGNLFSVEQALKRLGCEVIEWAKEAVRLGAGEILLTSMNQDGEKSGFDLALTKAVRQAVTVPVIASSGAGNAEHFTKY